MFLLFTNDVRAADSASIEQKMIESLGEHGVLASDLVPALMTTHTVANPEYDPEEARRQAEEAINNPPPDTVDSDDVESISDQTLVNEPLATPQSELGNKTPIAPTSPPPPPPLPEDTTSTITTTITKPDAGPLKQVPTTTKVLKESSTAAIPGVTTSLSSADQNVTLDIRWTVLCDLFLILIADSVYDARSRVLLEQVALKLGLGWLDVVKFESRVTQALEIQEDIETLEQQEIVDGARKAGRKRRYMMLGLATIGKVFPLTFLLIDLYVFVFCRWWTGYRTFRWSPCPCYRTRLSWSIDDCWRYWNHCILRRNGWSCYHHYRWCANRIRYRRQWYG